MSESSAAVRSVARRRYWREEQARRVVDDWRGSGESLSSYCRRLRIEPKRLGRWVARLGDGGDVRFHGGRVRFHPVRLVEPEAARAERFLEIDLPGGATVRLPAGFGIEDLRHVLSALAERPGC